MKLVKTENEGESSMKSTIKFSFVAPGSIGKGRGRGISLRSLVSKDNMSRRTLFPQSSDLVNKYIQSLGTGSIGEIQGQKNSSVAAANNMETSTITKIQGEKNSSMVAGKKMESGAIGKIQGQKNAYATAAKKMETSAIRNIQGEKNSSVAAGKEMESAAIGKIQREKNSSVAAGKEMENGAIGKIQGQKNSSVAAGKEMESGEILKIQGQKNSSVAAGKEIESGALGKIHGHEDSYVAASKEMESSGLGKIHGHRDSPMAAVTEREISTIGKKRIKITRSLGITEKEKCILNETDVLSNKRVRVGDKEHVQADTSVLPSTDEAIQHSNIIETGSSTQKKAKRVRGINKCKQVVSLPIGQKLHVTFYNKRTVGENASLFSRHLGKIVRDGNMCPLAVSSWENINQQQLDHMWAAVEDKFESVNFNDHRQDIMEWMRELWNKWRGNLHTTYARDRPIHQVLKKAPERVDPKDWEWLVKEHFCSKSFQEKSSRNAKNRSKMKMPHHMGSKPIRDFIYEKGGKDGNPPDFATIFYESHKKNNKLVEPAAVEKHAEIKELVEADPSLPNIEIIEKCFGAQNRSHVFGYGGGLRVKDMKGGTSKKAELLSKLRSTQEENKSLHQENKLLYDRLFALEDKMKDIDKLTEFVKAQQSNVPSTTSPVSTD